MSEVSSVLGKRLTSHTEEKAESLDINGAIVLHASEDNVIYQKRGRVTSELQDYATIGSMDGVEFLEAISLGTADQLTGTHGAPRQEQ
jgi:hypothetical protein